jgi:UDP-N-acetyl-D-mannosaminuronic acid dehydrogenase
LRSPVVRLVREFVRVCGSSEACSVAKPLGAVGFSRDAVVVGGCGHVGLPLAIALASRGVAVAIYDVSEPAVAAVAAGTMPFYEPGAAALLRSALAAGSLTVTGDPAVISSAEHVVVTVDGRVVDSTVESQLPGWAHYLVAGQLLVLRSTVPPSGTATLEKLCADLGLDVDVAYCPERIAEGEAMTELFELPQLVGSRTERGQERAARLFQSLTPVTVSMSPEEAELAKLFANAWRYVTFATANQLYAVANDLGLDYERIRQGVSLGYERAAQLPRAGFAAGPCLPKDTDLLASAHSGFSIGRAAAAANEGLADYVVSRLAQRYDLAGMCVGLLGMAFKAGCDDARMSLSYRLRRLLADRAASVLCTDALISGDADLLPLQDVVDRADLLVVATAHPQYRGLVTDKPVADIWGLMGKGVRT